MFIRFDMIHECDRQTDRQTDGRTDTACRHIPRLCIAWHGKNHHFYVPWPFCLPWGRPCGNHAKRCMNEKTIVFSFMQRYKYHYLIDYVRVLAKPLTACTHLSSTVSQLFQPQVQKIAIFMYRSPHFCFPWRRPCDYHAMCCMDQSWVIDNTNSN